MSPSEICLKYPIQNLMWSLKDDIFVAQWDNVTINKSMLRFIKSKDLNSKILDPWDRFFQIPLKIKTDDMCPFGDGKTLKTYISTITTVESHILNLVYILE